MIGNERMLRTSDANDEEKAAGSLIARDWILLLILFTYTVQYH
jgi:hypothetical protein